MTRAQCIVQRDNKILMVKHHLDGTEYWCLPGGGVESGETSSQAALRELWEECGVQGRVLQQTSTWMDSLGVDLITFLVDIGSQEPCLGDDPEFTPDSQILVDVQWLNLAEIPERDRAYLWAAGLLSLPGYEDEVSGWGDELSYPNH